MWRSRGIERRVGIVFLIILIGFASIINNTSNAQLDTPWDVSRESYVYKHRETRKAYDIDGGSGGTSTYIHIKTVEMWEVNSTGNEITFRTNNLEQFLGCVDCDSPECYEQYKEAWQYNEVDESLIVTYRYDKTEGKLGFLDPILGTLLSFYMDIPLNPVELPGYCLGLWEGMGFVFLPVLDDDFSFLSDFQNYEDSYDEFNIQVDDTFIFEGNKFEGYSYEIEHTFIDDISGRKWVDYANFSYNTKGILYTYYSETDFYRTVEGELQRSSHTELQYNIDTIDENLIVEVNWLLSILGFVILVALRKKKNRKNRFL